MKVVVLGVGRSGTTAMYRLLQNVLEKKSKNVSYAYEPYLWDHNKFDDLYENIIENFNYVDSISIEGVYENKKCPLFVTKSQKKDYLPNQFLENIFNKNEFLLAKFIRANGRINLLKKICPDCKFILITRNPLDTINSSSEMFSYFGDDFFESDYPRFKQEVLDIYNIDLQANSLVEREVLYWYYMNKFMLENYDENSMHVLTHEALINNRAHELKKIFKYLGLNEDDAKKYVRKSQKTVGPKTSTINITQDEFNFIKKYNDIYFNELSLDYGGISQSDVEKEYNSSTLLKIRENDVLFGKTTLFMKNHNKYNVEQVSLNSKGIIRKVLCKFKRKWT